MLYMKMSSNVIFPLENVSCNGTMHVRWIRSTAKSERIFFARGMLS